MVTIYDIAKAAKTSPASVSRVINDRGGVKPATAQRIKDTMEAMDFQPRWKALDRNRFLIFVPDYKRALCGGYVAGILSGITDAAFASGIGLQLRPFSTQAIDIHLLRQLFMQESVSGCILISMYQGYSLPSKLDLAGLPHVVIGHKKQDDDVNQILLDDRQAGREATEYLLSLGHKHIAMVSFSHVDQGHCDRYQGFAEAITKTNSKKPICLQCNDATYDAGKSAARHLLSPLERPTAVIITNEDIAAGFQAEAKRMGVSIPRDLSLIAFEETDKLSLLDTPLTSMQTPAYLMGIESVKMLKTLIVSDKKSTRPLVLTYTAKHMTLPLIARHSTGAIKI